MKDLSICIVAYNDEEDVLTAVKTLTEYTPSSFSKTVYIVDNSDRPNGLKEKLQEYPNVEYRKPDKNLGFGGGQNFVIPELDSKYHAIVNPDIVFMSDAFSPLVKFMEEHDCGMAVPRMTDEEGNLLKVYRLDPTPFDMFIRMFLKSCFKKRQARHTMQDMDYTRPFKVPFAQGSFLFVRTDIYRELKGFDENFFLYMEDADLCRRVNAVSSLLYCPDATVVHKWGRGSHKSFRLFCLHVSSMVKYFIKW